MILTFGGLTCHFSVKFHPVHQTLLVLLYRCWCRQARWKIHHDVCGSVPQALPKPSSLRKWWTTGWGTFYHACSELYSTLYPCKAVMHGQILEKIWLCSIYYKWHLMCSFIIHVLLFFKVVYVIIVHISLSSISSFIEIIATVNAW